MTTSGRADVGNPAGRPQRSDIQGLRALAVLLVVVFHAGLPVPGGFTGVDVFFVISGFVITAMLLSELTSTGRIDMRHFYTRRVKRLAPALALMVVTIAALGTIASPVAGQLVGAKTGVFASLFSANAYLFSVHTGYFDPATTLNPFLHTWTLAVEEQFYVFFPALLLLSWWVGRRARLLHGRGRWAAVLVVSVTTAASFVLALELSGSVWTNHRQFSFYGSPTRAWEFGTGALLALLVPWLRRMPQRPAQALGALGLVAIGVGAFAIHGATTFPVMATLLPVLGTGALLAAGTASRGGVGRVLGLRPAVWIGDLSYSWYLWHWPLIVFATALWPGAGWAAPALAALSLLPAWLSYRYVENPIRFNRRIAGRRVLGLAAICIAVPIGACLALEETARRQAATAMKSYERSQVRHLDFRLGCYSAPPGVRTSGPCTLRVPRKRGWLVLIGDSNAGQFSEPVVRAGNRAGFDVTIKVISSCPFVDLSVIYAERQPGFSDPRKEMDSCRRFYVRSLDALVRLRPNLVVTSARADAYIGRAVVGLGSPSGDITHLARAKGQLYSRGLASTLRRLNDAGVPVVIVHPVPVVQSTSVYECAVIRILTDSCVRSVARGAIDQSLQLSVAAGNRAVATAPAAWALDFRNRLCNQDRCTGKRGDTLLYRDKNHLSVDGALELTNEFYRAILAHTRP